MERLDKTPVIKSFFPAKKPVFAVMSDAPSKNRAELSHAPLDDLLSPDCQHPSCHTCPGGTWLCALGSTQVRGRLQAL